MKRIVMFFLISSLLLAKDINVGDLVKFKVSGIEKERIAESFKNSKLQLEDIKKSDDGYIVSIRGYEVGESSINLGDKKLTLNIKSVLTDEDKEIYPHLSDSRDTLLYSKNFPYTIVVGGVLALASLVYLLKGVKFKRETIISSEKRFEDKISNLSDESWDFELSMAIREYIDSKYKTHFVNGKYEVVGMITIEDIKFIENLDRYKFSKDSRDLKTETLERVKNIFERVRGDKNV